MAQYIGLHLEITLTDGSVVIGVVAALDEQTTYMTLGSVTIRGIDGLINELPVFVIHGSQIRHLEVIQKPPQQQQHVQPPQQPSISQPPAPPSIPQQQQQPQTPPKQQASQFVDPAIISMSIPPSPAAPVKKMQEKKPQPLQPPPSEFNKPNEVTTPSAPPKSVVVNNKSIVASTSTTKSTKSSTRSPKSKTTTTAAVVAPKKEDKKESTSTTASPASSTLSPAFNGKAVPKSTSSRLPFFASTRAKQPRKPIIETEVFDFEELYGSATSTPKSSKSKHKASSTTGVVEKQTKSDTKATVKEKEKEKEKDQKKQQKQKQQQQQQEEELVAITAPTPTVPTATTISTNTTIPAVNKADNNEKKKASKANEVVNQEASALLASMLHLQGSPKQQQEQPQKSPKEEPIEEVDTEELIKSPSSSSSSSQPSFKIPANLIPPKARSTAKSNGNKVSSSPKASPPTPKEKSKEKVQSPKEKTKEKSSLASPKEKSPKPTKEKSSPMVDGKEKTVKEKTLVKEKSSSPVFTTPAIVEKNGKVQEEDEEENEDSTMPIIKTVVNGARCPVVTIEQMHQVEEICVSETGPNEEMMIENAGHGTSVMALKAIGGHRRIQPGNHNAAPVIVVLTGNTKAGSYGLAAARHLANRGCHVYVMLAFRKDTKLSDGVTMQRKCAEFAGAHIVDNIEDLPQQQKTPVDLIIDGLMGSEYSVSLLRGDYVTRELLWASMDWANSNKAPVLSLDFPSGINASDGLPFHVMHHIQPKWTLCFGAPKQGCTSRSITGELFLADIGIPSVSWRRIGINRCKIPWGAEFVLALEYDG